MRHGHLFHFAGVTDKEIGILPQIITDGLIVQQNRTVSLLFDIFHR